MYDPQIYVKNTIFCFADEVLTKRVRIQYYHVLFEVLINQDNIVIEYDIYLRCCIV